MERGPMALFGAIVAVGLGPAMWLGAQFGNAITTPTRPPAVTSERNPQQDKGGGAGSAPEDPAVDLQTTPRANIKPLTPSAQPSASTSAPGSDSPAAGPSASPPATPGDHPTTPTTGPTSDPPTGADNGGPVPSPPPSSPDQGVGIHLPVL